MDPALPKGAGDGVHHTIIPFLGPRFIWPKYEALLSYASPLLPLQIERRPPPLLARPLVRHAHRHAHSQRRPQNDLFLASSGMFPLFIGLNEHTCRSNKHGSSLLDQSWAQQATLHQQMPQQQPIQRDATRFFGTNKNHFLYSKLDDGTKDGRTKTGTRPKTCCRGSHSSPS